jgi:hypothetical protein
MIDDATSWSWGRFVERDATPQNMGVLWEYLEKNGRMEDVYTDRDSMFTVPPRPGESKEQQRAADRLTQLGRAMRELGIGSILAYSPQAKAYASYCTSCEPWKTFSGKRRRLASLTPWALHGGLGPGSSYNQSSRSFTG